MAGTVTQNARLKDGDRVREVLFRDFRMDMGTCAFSGTYATGGIAVDTTVGTVVWGAVGPNVSGYAFELVPSSKKVKIYEASGSSGAASEIASGSSLTGFTSVPYLIVGY